MRNAQLRGFFFMRFSDIVAYATWRISTTRVKFANIAHPREILPNVSKSGQITYKIAPNLIKQCVNRISRLLVNLVKNCYLLSYIIEYSPSLANLGKSWEAVPILPKTWHVLPNLITYGQVLPNIAKTCQIMSNIAKSFRILPNLVKSCQIAPNLAQ